MIVIANEYATSQQVSSFSHPRSRFKDFKVVRHTVRSKSGSSHETRREKFIYLAEAAFATFMGILLTKKGSSFGGELLISIGAIAAAKSLSLLTANTFSNVFLQLASLYLAVGILGRFTARPRDAIASLSLELIGINFLLLGLIELFFEDLVVVTLILAFYNFIATFVVDVKHYTRDLCRCLMVLTVRLVLLFF